MFSALRGSYDLCKLLIEKKADINMKDNDGWTALDYASQYGTKEVVKLLLENGADPDIKTGLPPEKLHPQAEEHKLTATRSCK